MMWGRCRRCGAYASLNPYPDSLFYRLCFACQMRAMRVQHRPYADAPANTYEPSSV